jgi:SAM-dependent methyltransferase
MHRHVEVAAPREPLPAWAAAVLIHAACTIAAYGLAPGASWMWLEGGCAAALGVISGLPAWWLPINLLFVPGAHALHSLALPTVLYPAAFGALFVVNAAAWRHRVPLFLSSTKAAEALAAWLPPRAGFRFLDLGCGTGSLLADLVRARPDGDYTGIETAPLPFAISWWRLCKCADARVAWGDFWCADFSQYDVVYAYLSPEPMARLWEKARREMRPGSLFVSNSFGVPGHTPAHAVPVADAMRSILYLWRM